MALTPKFLADGQLPNTKTTLYTCPASTITFITRIALVNTDSSDRTVNVYIKRAAGTSRHTFPVDANIVTKDSLEWNSNLGGSYILGAGDVLEGSASVAAVVDYTIFGAEQT